jgi:hypothetical protein
MKEDAKMNIVCDWRWKLIAVMSLALFAGVPALGLAGHARNGAPEDIEFTFDLHAPSGAPFDGEIDVYVSQEFGTGYMEWGPVRTTVVAGQVDFVFGLSGYSHGFDGRMSIWPVKSGGGTNADQVFFVSAADSVQGEADFSTSVPNGTGEYPATVTTVDLYEAPLLGDLTFASMGPEVDVVVTLYEVYFPGRLDRGQEVNAVVGTTLELYGWTGSVQYGYNARTVGGWGVAYGGLAKGASSTPELEELGSLRVSFDPIAHPYVISALLYPQVDYQALDLSGVNSNEAWAKVTSIRSSIYFGTVNGTVGTKLSSDEILFDDMPQGDYVLEVWSDGGLNASPPAPVYSGAVTLLGGLEVIVLDVPVGVPFCNPADANSTGLPVVISGAFNSGVGSNLHFEAIQGVPGQFGYFLIGTGVSEPGLPVSDGHLCLAVSGTNSFGRYNVIGGQLDSIGQFDSAGILQNGTNTSTTGTGYDVPLDIPITGYAMILSGDVWNFQLWYRNDNTGVSNFSNGLTVTFP